MIPALPGAGPAAPRRLWGRALSLLLPPRAGAFAPPAAPPDAAAGQEDAARPPAPAGLFWPHDALLLAASAALATLQILSLVPNSDVLWLMEVAHRIVHGGGYYTDFIETNPPLYPLLLVPIDLLSRCTAVPAYTLFILAVAALILWVSFCFSRWLAALLPGTALTERTGLALCLQAALFLLPQQDFGERDIIGTLLTLPALFHFSLLPPKQPLRVSPRSLLLILCATAGMLIKPHLLLIGVSCLAVRVAGGGAEGIWRAWVLPAAGLAAAYLLLIILFFPGYLTVVRTFGGFYASYLPDPDLIDAPTLVTLWLILGGFGLSRLLASRLCWPPQSRLAGRYIGAATLGALGSYVLQHKPFPYHYIPVPLLMTLWLLWWLAHLAPTAASHRTRHNLLLALLLCALDLFAMERASLRRDHLIAATFQDLSAQLTALHAGHRLYFLTLLLTPEFPLHAYYPGSSSCTRFSGLWPLPGILAQDRRDMSDPQRLSAADRALTHIIAQDLARCAPTAVVVGVSTKHIIPGARFKILPWLLRDPQLRQILQRRYQRAGSLQGRSLGLPSRSWDVYLLKQRRAPQPPGAEPR